MKFPVKPILSLMAAAALLTGCGSSSSGGNGDTPPATGNADGVTTKTVAALDSNASNPAAWIYFSLEQNSTVTPADPDNSTEWDLAFAGTNLKLNGGASGSKGVGAFFTGNNADFYDAGTPVLAKFQAATAASELPDLKNAAIPGGVVYEMDTGTASADRFFCGSCASRGYYAYNLEGTHKIYPNFRVYLIDTGSKVYALQISGYYHPETLEARHITFRYKEVQ